MTGWELLEELAELADKEPDKLDAEVYSIWKKPMQIIALKPKEIEYIFDKKSNNKGLFLTSKGDN